MSSETQEYYENPVTESLYAQVSDPDVTYENINTPDVVEIDKNATPAALDVFVIAKNATPNVDVINKNAAEDKEGVARHKKAMVKKYCGDCWEIENENVRLN